MRVRSKRHKQRGRLSKRRERSSPSRRSKSSRSQNVSSANLVGLAAVTAIFIASVAIAFGFDRDSSGGTVKNIEPEALAPRETQARAVEQEEPTPPSSPIARRFERCGSVRETCVVDGDTFWLEGVKIRIADIDTPEISQPGCAFELELGERATDRLIELLNQGPFELNVIGARDEDQFGRKLRVVARDGTSIGDQLVREGLARTWTGQREPWC